MGWFDAQLHESEIKDREVLKETYRRIDESLEPKNRLKLDGNKGSELSLKELLHFSLGFMKPKESIAIIAITLVSIGAGFALPELTHYLVTDVPASGSMSALKSAVFWIALATFFICVIKGVRGIVRVLYGNRASERARSEVMRRLLGVSSNFFREYSSAELAERIEYVAMVCDLMFMTVYDNVLEALMSLVYLVEVAKYAPQMVLPSFIIIALTLIVSFYTGVQRAKAFRVSLESTVNENGKFSELLNAIRKIKTSGAEKRAFSVWGKLYEKNVKATYNPPFSVRYADAFINGVTLIGSAVIYLIAAFSGISRENYFTFLSVYALMTATFATLPLVVEQTAQAGAAFQLIKPILDAEAETKENLPKAGDITGKISIKNVTFSYNGRRNILDDFSLEIKAGEYLAVTGGSGCGKSTLIRLLLGLEKPTEGEILYDGYNLEDVDPVSIRRHIGSVMQDGRLLNDSIKVNVSIANPALSDDEIWEALDEANIAEDVERMPMRLETMMNEETGAVSGGQKQRILIARALASKPSILILDEATSALDNIAQKKVTQTLDRLDCTRIVVAHRLSTIKNCDRIIFIENGKITEDGSYDELLKKNGGFAQLIKRQQI